MMAKADHIVGVDWHSRLMVRYLQIQYNDFQGFQAKCE